MIIIKIIVTLIIIIIKSMLNRLAAVICWEDSIQEQMWNVWSVMNLNEATEGIQKITFCVDKNNNNQCQGKKILRTPGDVFDKARKEISRRVFSIKISSGILIKLDCHFPKNNKTRLQNSVLYLIRIVPCQPIRFYHGKCFLFFRTSTAWRSAFLIIQCWRSIILEIGDTDTKTLLEIYWLY